MAAVKELLLETLNELRDKELEKFKKFLSSQPICSFISFSELLDLTSNRKEISDLMLEKFGQQCVEMTRQSLIHINRTDLIQRHGWLSGSKSKSVMTILLCL